MAIDLPADKDNQSQRRFHKFDDGTFSPVVVVDNSSTPGGDVNVTNGPTNPVSIIGSTGIFTLRYDYISAAYPSGTQEVYTTRLGGSGGSIQEVLTINYTDSTKSAVSNISRA